MKLPNRVSQSEGILFCIFITISDDELKMKQPQATGYFFQYTLYVHLLPNCSRKVPNTHPTRMPTLLANSRRNQDLDEETPHLGMVALFLNKPFQK